MRLRLNDPLITYFVYEDKKYTINLAFDTVLDVFDYLDDKTLREHETARICLALLLGNQDYEQSKTIDLWNYIYESFIHIEEKKAVEYDLKGNPMPTNDEDEGKKLFDLEHDAEYIYSSFMQAYNIDLFEQQGKMHWFKFKSLLNGLPDDTPLKNIMSIRNWKPSKGESTEFKKSMEKLQRIHALPKEVD